MSFKIVYTDHQFENLEMERKMFGEIEGEVIDGERTDEPLESLVRDADALVVMYAVIDADLIESMTKCQVINRSGIGFDNVDLEAATKKGIYVTNVPDYCISEVSDHTLALILALQRKIVFYHNRISEGVWDLTEGPPMHRLEGQTLGLVAFGHIAREVCRKALALGMNVIAYDPFLADEEIMREGAEPVQKLDELMKGSDVVSVHAPLTSQTRGLIGKEELSFMKETAFIVNTARGGIIDEQALVESLDEGRIMGAALDVLMREPPEMDNRLIGHPRIILTPHAAWNSVESELERRRKSALSVMDRLKGGVPRYLVNKEVLEGIAPEESD